MNKETTKFLDDEDWDFYSSLPAPNHYSKLNKKVWVNGTFDVLHNGHIRLLKYAYSYGEVTVGIDTDRRIKELKGELRPYNSLKDRIEMLSSIVYVSNIIVFDDSEELKNAIKRLNPDYLIVGEEYRKNGVIGSEYAKELIFFPRIEKYSTTKILNYESNSYR
jgi:D-beta-D-heptose 7-phosphate kinase/D-beta-D-heptose 1-phosphate adenosyltransferase